jgi:hypothetical protein
MGNEFKVGKDYRTNPWSQTPGGVSIVVTYKDGKKLIYDNIKNPDAYIKKVKKNSMVADAYVHIPE